jgi:hypothetical protein
MTIKLPLDKMSVAEKVATMESLWEDLSRSPQSVESPDWHREVLEQRTKDTREGSAQFKDWNKAKSDIRSKVE